MIYSFSLDIFDILISIIIFITVVYSLMRRYLELGFDKGFKKGYETVLDEEFKKDAINERAFTVFIAGAAIARTQNLKATNAEDAKDEMRQIYNQLKDRNLL